MSELSDHDAAPDTALSAAAFWFLFAAVWAASLAAVVYSARWVWGILRWVIPQ